MINYYKKSKKEFINYIRNNPLAKRDEWDNYAHKHCLFSAFTLSCHVDVYSFEELKKKIK